jgi:hypothetical protein
MDDREPRELDADTRHVKRSHNNDVGIERRAVIGFVIVRLINVDVVIFVNVVVGFGDVNEK